jgi:molecular chaperone GrpE
MEEEKNLELEVDVVEDDIDCLKQALEEEKCKAEKYLGNWQRSEADLSNYKKRAEQERGEFAQFANTTFILTLLPILDDLERAFNTIPHELEQLTWVEGIRLIWRKLWVTLEAQGISVINTIGEKFDPAVHEAVHQGEGEEGEILEELQKGYKLRDRLIRPALVVVGGGKGNEYRDEGGDEEEEGD